jgi:CBS domain-containing protein
MKVRELIAGQKVITGTMRQTLEELAAVMAREHVTGLPIVDDWGALAGLVTASTVIELAGGGLLEGRALPQAAEWGGAGEARSKAVDWRKLSARDAMVTDLCTVDEDATVRQAAQALVNRGVHRAVVLRADRTVAGVVSSMDFTLLVAEGKSG